VQQRTPPRTPDTQLVEYLARVGGARMGHQAQKQRERGEGEQHRRLVIHETVA